jgi:spermidine synthase
MVRNSKNNNFFTLVIFFSLLIFQGIICTQAECLWLHLKFISSLLQSARELFSTVRYAYTTIPTYPSGSIGFCIATKSGSLSLETPLRTPEEAMTLEDSTSLQYYSPRVHSAAFVLPVFAEKEFNSTKK